MTSTTTRKALLLVWCVLSLHHFLQYSISHNLAVASKVTTLAMESMFFLADCLLLLQAVFRFSKTNATMYIGYHYTNLSYIRMIFTNGLMNSTESITIRVTATATATAIFSGLSTYDLWYLGCILYHLFFVHHFVNVNSQ